MTAVQLETLLWVMAILKRYIKVGKPGMQPVVWCHHAILGAIKLITLCHSSTIAAHFAQLLRPVVAQTGKLGLFILRDHLLLGVKVRSPSLQKKCRN